MYISANLFIPKSFAKPANPLLQSFSLAQFSKNINCLITAPRRIALSPQRPVGRRIRALPSDGPLRFRTAPDHCTLALEIVRRVTSLRRRVSPSDRVRRALTQTRPVPKAVRYYRLPLIAYRLLLTSSPHHCRVSTMSLPVPPSLRPVRHVTHPHQPSHMAPRHPSIPDPTYDVMLMSSVKKAPKTNFSIFFPKNTFFLTFL